MLRIVRCCFAVAATTLLGAASAAATPTPATATPATATPATATGANAAAPPGTTPRELHGVAVTFSPVHLLLPIVELTGEVALGSRASLALIAGVGQIRVSTLEAGEKTKRKLDVWEFGGQANVYLLGNFDHGMQLGLEALYTDISLPPGTEVTGSADGLAIGPFLGYKFSAPIGFTFNGQLGFQFMTINAEGQSDGETITREQRVLLPLLNLNLGWAL